MPLYRFSLDNFDETRTRSFRQLLVIYSHDRVIYTQKNSAHLSVSLEIILYISFNKISMKSRFMLIAYCRNLYKAIDTISLDLPMQMLIQIAIAPSQTCLYKTIFDPRQ